MVAGALVGESGGDKGQVWGQAEDRHAVGKTLDTSSQRDLRSLRQVDGW